jgi:starch synthase
MDTALRILFVTPEASPLAISGELADFTGSLPKYLGLLGAEVSLILPRYRCPAIEALRAKPVLRELRVPLGSEILRASVWKTELGPHAVYLVDYPKYFGRDRIYGSSREEYPDNDERFIFFNRAVLEFLIQGQLKVDILHCHNWPTALIPVFLKTHYADSEPLRGVATVFTLHNAAYQGRFPAETLALAGLGWDLFASRRVSFNGQFNFLKAGAAFSDALNTVSSAYKREILTSKEMGLAEVIKARAGRFSGIRNGIDLEVWNPEADPFITAPFSAVDPAGKAACKKSLLDEFGLTPDLGAPLLGLVTHLTPLKGSDLLLEAAAGIMGLGFKIVLAGVGEERYIQALNKLKRTHPQSLGLRFEMSPALCHKVIAGSDMILIPSRHEPCGLNQFYGFRYGTVPVVRAVGGLRETVRPFRPASGEGNGFVFRRNSGKALLRALLRARDCYRRPECWSKIMSAGFGERPSWEEAARKYLELYRTALNLRRRERHGRLD